MISQEKAIRLQTSDEVPCEIYLKSKPSYPIELLSVVSTSPTIELFAGQIAEYVETASGDLIDDVDGDKFYEYHFNIPRNVTNVMLKVFSSRWK